MTTITAAEFMQRVREGVDEREHKQAQYNARPETVNQLGDFIFGLNEPTTFLIQDFEKEINGQKLKCPVYAAGIVTWEAITNTTPTTDEEERVSLAWIIDDAYGHIPYTDFDGIPLRAITVI